MLLDSATRSVRTIVRLTSRSSRKSQYIAPKTASTALASIIQVGGPICPGLTLINPPPRPICRATRGKSWLLPILNTSWWSSPICDRLVRVPNWLSNVRYQLPLLVPLAYQSSRITSLRRDSPIIASRPLEPGERRPVVFKVSSSKRVSWKL